MFSREYEKAIVFSECEQLFAQGNNLPTWAWKSTAHLWPQTLVNNLHTQWLLLRITTKRPSPCRVLKGAGCYDCHPYPTVMILYPIVEQKDAKGMQILKCWMRMPMYVNLCMVLVHLPTQYPLSLCTWTNPHKRVLYDWAWSDFWSQCQGITHMEVKPLWLRLFPDCSFSKSYVLSLLHVMLFFAALNDGEWLSLFDSQAVLPANKEVPISTGDPAVHKPLVPVMINRY